MIRPTAVQSGDLGVVVPRVLGRPDPARLGRIELAVGVAILLVILVAPAFAPQPPLATSIGILRPPSWHHLLGTDRLGRDILSRFLAGGQLIMVLSLLAGILATSLGALIGLSGGYLRGATDLILMRLVDVLLALPAILVILVVAAALPRSNTMLVALVGVLLAPGAARILRGLAQQLAAREFVAAAEAAGGRWYSILWAEILPNIRGRLLLEVALRTGFAVVLISSLNFLGVGVSPPTPDWGLEISEGRTVMMLAPLVVVVPAVGLAVLVGAVNLVADGLDRLLR